MYKLWKEINMIIEFIPIFFLILLGYKMWKTIISENDPSEVFSTGMIYGGMFVLSFLLTNLYILFFNYMR